MSTPVPLPALGESVTEGTVSRWLKQVGDTVEVDEPIVEVSTDKVDTEIPAPAAGVILEIKVGEDEVAAVGAVLAVIGDASEAGGSSDAAPAAPAENVPAEQADAEEPEAPAVAEAPSTDAPAPKPAAGGGGSGTEVTLPQLGESVTEGTISRWLKAVGDEVEADEPIVEVSTDKVDTEIPAPTSGVILEIRVAEDEVAAVGAVIAVIGAAGAAPAEAEAPSDAPEVADETPAEPRGDGITESEERGNEQTAEKAGAEQSAEAPAPAAPAPSAPAPAAPAAAAPAPAAPAASSDSDDAGYVTPLVRKLAAQHGVQLSGVKGTGVGGRVRKQDVLAAAEAAKKAAEAPAPAAAPAAAAPSAPAPAAAPAAQAAPPEGSKRGTTEKISRMRSVIAKRMVESLQIAAQLTGTVEVDLTNISKLRARAKDDFKAREGASLSYLPFICKAVCEALKQFDKVNASMDVEAGTITYHDAEHLGIAVDTERGLLVPVIRDAGDLSLAGLAKKIGDVAARSRTNKISPDELSGGTFTITNYGSAGTLFDTPIINQPQAAILGTGALVKRPMVIKDPALGEVIAVRDMMYLSLSYDHRLVDGADAARFLSVVKARLEGGDFAGELGL
ncbi:2-oxoglutarate dehydrogenase, E2 component, dihydrolipoamide succinyltransferase [Micropruina glycogenica]|uniref:Dihydrolipoamide acetyltransferase component of pyruvate dehydrogenase complex n=1 Tax=Micropruina glycogenica TaxID=75385 RepID=A0A2N9JI90_9ACTN|nr:2-oxoglutarate dehydrogenase, E2 component, dihydrolipoamide succinyltransferase [Micropruina glycogenica]SPD87496.1 Dihydrolipoyllysine-residue acetyltransferase component of pyruvate dehydrogenase complex [Micropruina glycogenica]